MRNYIIQEAKKLLKSDKSVKIIFGFDPQYKNVVFKKLLTYKELEKLRCNQVPHWDPEVEDFEKKHKFKNGIEAFNNMPVFKQKEIIKRNQKIIDKRCAEYMSSRIEEDAKVRKILAAENKIYDHYHTPKYFAIYPYMARDMYKKNWNNYIIFDANEQLLQNTVFMVVYLKNNKILIRTFGTGFKGLKKAIEFWNNLPENTKQCDKHGFCARIQGATYDIKSFYRSYKDSLNG